MALDKNLSLREAAPPALGLPLLPERIDGPKSSECALLPVESIPSLAAAGWRDTALVMPSEWQKRLSAALASDWGTGDNPYALLERNGVFAVSPCRPKADGLVLSGGSYSSVSVHPHDGRPVVRKRLSVTPPVSRDREERQLGEIEWLSRVPAAVRELFAPIAWIEQSDAHLELATEFVAGYTLAELVFQGRLDDKQLAERLEAIYTAVSSVIWTSRSLSPPIARSAETYVERIRRRMQDVLASDYADDGGLRSLIEASRVIVNGQKCTGVRPLLEKLDGNSQWKHVVSPARRTLCHGDLILEDILISDSLPNGFRLIDPNPANESPIYDLGKTMMSLWLGYEPLYFDLFSLDWENGKQGDFHLEINVGAAEVQAIYLDATDRFLPYVERELAQHLRLPTDRLKPALRMSAAIHMLAIPVFHLLHHRKEERALAFAGTALLHAQAALDGEAPSPSRL